MRRPRVTVADTVSACVRTGVGTRGGMVPAVLKMTTTTRWFSWVAAVTLAACGGGSGGDSPDAFIPAGADAAGADGSGAGDPDAAPPAACARLAEKHARADQALAGFLLE